MRRLLLFILMSLSITAVFAQINAPETHEIYRLIVDRNKDRAGDVYWVEIQQRTSGLAIDWVMARTERIGDTLERTCYRALFVGEGTPVYTVNGEPIPQDSAQALREAFEGNRLILNSERFVDEDVECVEEGQGEFDGSDTNICRFEGVDASGIFRLRGAAQASGEIRTAVDGGYLVYYEFNAEGTASGSNNIVRHTYALTRTDDIRIDFPTDVDLLCFDDGFPNLPDTQIVSNSLNYLVALSDRIPDDLWTELNLSLLDRDWVLDQAVGDQRFYDLDLGEGDTCRLRAQVRRGDAGTQLGVTVTPLVALDNVDLPPGWESPIVIQNADFTVRYMGSVGQAAAEYIAAAPEWAIRDELTDIRDDSALVVLTDGVQEQYITIDAAGSSSTVSVQYGDVCALD